MAKTTKPNKEDKPLKAFGSLEKLVKASMMKPKQVKKDK